MHVLVHTLSVHSIYQYKKVYICIYYDVHSLFYIKKGISFIHERNEGAHRQTSGPVLGTHPRLPSMPGMPGHSIRARNTGVIRDGIDVSMTVAKTPSVDIYPLDPTIPDIQREDRNR
jgi:hypothetical protein